MRLPSWLKQGCSPVVMYLIIIGELLIYSVRWLFKI